jgi:hypothetical protein
MYFPKKVFYGHGVFELPLLRNAQKRHKKNLKKKKKSTYLPLYHLPGIRRFQFYFSSASAPLAPRQSPSPGPKPQAQAPKKLLYY